jgi:alpha-L-arabinofuranosidase
MASYAPLFGNVKAWQWRPDLIWFDNLKSAATPNYYIQKMFSANAGTDLITALVDGKPLNGQDSLYASACFDAKTSELVVKIANVAHENASVTLSVEGKTPSAKEISMQVIASSKLDAFNQVGKPEVISPVERKQKISGKKIALNLDPYSFTVARIPVKK